MNTEQMDAALAKMGEAIRKIPELLPGAGPLPARTRWRRITIVSEAEVCRMAKDGYMLITRFENRAAALVDLLRIYGLNLRTRDPVLVVTRGSEGRKWAVAAKGERMTGAKLAEERVRSMRSVPAVRRRKEPGKV